MTERAPTGDVLARVRALCLGLPGVSERVSHGEPTWFAGGRMFVTFADRHHDDVVGFWCAAPAGLQEALVGERPALFFRPPYVGGRGWLGVRLDRTVDWDEIAELIETAYETVTASRRPPR